MINAAITVNLQLSRRGSMHGYTLWNPESIKPCIEYDLWKKQALWNILDIEIMHPNIDAVNLTRNWNMYILGYERKEMFQINELLATLGAFGLF